MNPNRLDYSVDRASAVFPTLDADLSDGLRNGSETAKRICIATPDILGPVKNGGIGTAYHHVARFLAELGHDVVIAFVNGNASNARLMEEVRAFYAGFGVAFEPIAPRRIDNSVREQVSAPTWALLDWLRATERPFDIVHVSEWRGLGYGPLLAKSQGLAFGATHFVVKGSSPTLWQVEGNRQLLSRERELGWVFMEQRSIELADTVICGSAHLLEWMRAAGYALPARSFVWPNVFPAPDPSPAAAAERAARNGAPLDEVVFFGRLEPRKGLILFVDAIDRLARQGRAPARVTFLGGSAQFFNGLRHIQDRAEHWPARVRTITDFGAREAIAYLSHPGRLAVIPSLLENSSVAVMECLQEGIPFVAAATGGTPELVASQDHGRALVAPDHIVLGNRIADLANAPLRAVQPCWDFHRALKVWAHWHAQTAPFEERAERFAERERVVNTGTPLVTVCIVHYERPELLRMAVDSVLAQDYSAMEAVLVDDGSESDEAHETLDALESDFLRYGWRVIRQENCYLGAARNAAAAAAHGEWLLFLDDDNVLFPDAVSRLVRAARFSGADCITAASIRFSGEGDPRLDTKSHLAPIRFFGAALASNLFHNVIGDACALVRRSAFESVGGFEEERGFALSDMSFFNCLIQAGYGVEYMPDTTFYYRVLPTSMLRSSDRSSAMHRHFVTMPYLKGLSAEERALASYAIGCIDQAGVPRRLAESAMRRGNWAAACELWEELREAFPDDASGYVRGAAALLEAGRPEEAEGLACEALERFPEHSGGYVQRAEVSMRREDWAVAIGRWEAVRGAFPDHASGYVRGAEALLNAGRLEEAEGLACEALERFPDRPGGCVQRAEVSMRREDWAVAIGRWEAVRGAFPDHASGYVRGAEALLNAGRLEEAEGLACEALERFPDRPGAVFSGPRCRCAGRSGRLAIGRWEAVRVAFPQEASGYVRGAEALLEAGRVEEAEGLACEATERFPEHPGGYVQRAEAAMRCEEWAVACERWEELRRGFSGPVVGV